MKVALILVWGYELLVGMHLPGAVGGAEVQMTRIARHLARRKQEVWFLCGDPGNGREQTLDGVRILPAFQMSGGLPILRFFQMKRDLEAAMARADADVYVQRCASPLTGIAASWARRHGRKFVYMVANDPNVDGRYEASANLRDRWFYRRGLEQASGIVAQTDWQAREIERRLGRQAVILPSLLEIPAEIPAPTDPDIVLWAASFQPHKRPHLLLEIARKAPELRFVVAGHLAGDLAYGERFVAEAKTVPNVELLGEVPHPEMAALYRRSVALLGTSEHEGFPNTFLEAWSEGTPVVSLAVDPDGMIRRHGLGAVTGDLDLVVEELRALRDDPARRAKIAVAARRSIERHSAERVAAGLDSYLAALVAGRDESGAARAAEAAAGVAIGSDPAPVAADPAPADRALRSGLAG